MVLYCRRVKHERTSALRGTDERVALNQKSSRHVYT